MVNNCYADGYIATVVSIWQGQNIAYENLKILVLTYVAQSGAPITANLKIGHINKIKYAHRLLFSQQVWI